MKRSHLIVTPAKMSARRRDARCSKVVTCSCPSLGCVLSEISGDVSTADSSAALDVSASTNSAPIWKHMGEPLADVLLANALVTCYLAYVKTTRAVIGLFLVCPHVFRPNFTKYFQSRRGVTMLTRPSLPLSSQQSTGGSEYWVYHKHVEPARLHLSDPCSNTPECA